MAQRAAPALAGIVVIAAVGAAALRVGESNRHAAEADRLAARHRLVVGLRGNVDAALDPTSRERTVAATPFAPDDPAAATEGLLRQFHNSESAGAVAALVGVDGQVRASIPPGATVDVGLLGPAWREGVQGRAALTNGPARSGRPGCRWRPDAHRSCPEDRRR